jgi:paraquat-inducible protein A
MSPVRRISTPTMTPADACPTCGQVHAEVALKPREAAYCVRCGQRLEHRTPASLHLTAALALAALVLFVPANLFPILYLSLYGRRTSNTVIDGVRVFYHDGEYAMAVIVLLASIVVPVVKLTGLFYLVLSVWFGSRRHVRFRTGLFRFIDVIGRWAMLDVFVVGVWVATVKLRTVGDVTPGEGLLPFGGMAFLTLLASSCFDPRLLWDAKGRARPRGASTDPAAGPEAVPR